VKPRPPKGVKVVRTETKSWEVPYCLRCAEHQDAAADRDRAKEKVAGAKASYSRSFWWTVLLLGLGTPLVLAYGLGLLLVFPGLVALAVALVRRARLTRLRTSMTAADADVHANTRDGCVDEYEAVGYLGWNGSIHRFWIENDDYRRRFERSNADSLC